MTFCLNSTIIEPEEKIINNIVILLHGYGGDGNDIGMLSYNWKRFLKNTLFLCPDGPEVCKINPAGYQWFDLNSDDPNYILKQVKIAESKLNLYIEEVKKKYNLDNSKICLSGFSQGCMMSINVGITAEQNFNCIVGFSGKIINKEDLLPRLNINNNLLMIHGDSDEIVSPNSLLDAKDFFMRNKVNVETLMIKGCGHNIPMEASSAALNFIKKNFNL
tara:strand:+ start:2533 stop:3186 length:654 start_codon:yes stop_codon:yes gene_type:complete